MRNKKYNDVYNHVHFFSLNSEHTWLRRRARKHSTERTHFYRIDVKMRSERNEIKVWQKLWYTRVCVWCYKAHFIFDPCIKLQFVNKVKIKYFVIVASVRVCEWMSECVSEYVNEWASNSKSNQVKGWNRAICLRSYVHTKTLTLTLTHLV